MMNSLREVVLAHRGSEHFADMLTLAHSKVAKLAGRHAQVMEVVNHLTKKVYFRDRAPPPAARNVYVEPAAVGKAIIQEQA